MASVPVDERTKAMLGELQESIERETGRNVNQGELLERIVEREFESRDALVDSFRSDTAGGENDEFDGLSDEETERWLSGTAASGDPIDEDDIDRTLYDEEAAPDFDTD
jgi:hypothetical protein